MLEPCVSRDRSESPHETACNGWDSGFVLMNVHSLFINHKVVIVIYTCTIVIYLHILLNIINNTSVGGGGGGGPYHSKVQ